MDAFSKSYVAGGKETLPALIWLLCRATMTEPGNADEKSVLYVQPTLRALVSHEKSSSNRLLHIGGLLIVLIMHLIAS